MSKYVVRFGVMRSLAVMSDRGQEAEYARGQRVVARTKRGLELGEVLCVATPESLDAQDYETGEIVRQASTNDENEFSHIESSTTTAFETCRRYVQKLKLEMELVDIEHIFGGERIVIYYLAENRVDFRELVRQLAKEFQTRIEMRQIGVRDEAKLLADYGDCGKPVCCAGHLSSMPPVSMKMAKIQKATLDPTKISGRCGRLKCCLRYEYETYVDMQKELPPIGSEIVTREGKAIVLGHEILASQLLVETEENRRTIIDAADVLSIIRVGKGPKKGERRGKSKTTSKATSKAAPGNDSRSRRKKDARDDAQDAQVKSKANTKANTKADHGNSGTTNRNEDQSNDKQAKSELTDSKEPNESSAESATNEPDEKPDA